MRKLFLPMLLITALTVTPLTTSCGPNSMEGFGQGYADFIMGAVIITGVVIFLLISYEDEGGPHHDADGTDHSVLDDIMVPIDPVHLTPSPELNTIIGDFKTPSERDWYSIPIQNPGDTVTVWAESVEGTMAFITDEIGNICKSDNGDQPGSNFRIEIHALDQVNVNLMVYGIYEDGIYRNPAGTDHSKVATDIICEPRTYTLHWVYEFAQ